MDRLALGSCAPFSHPNIVPPPKTGQQCHPGLVPHIAVKIAELKGISVDDVLEAAWASDIAALGRTRMGWCPPHALLRFHFANVRSILMVCVFFWVAFTDEQHETVQSKC